MKSSRLTCRLLIVLSCLTAIGCTIKEQSGKTELPASGPIQLHPENPHYFLYKGKPLALITSAEHYGAVINKAFDYNKYLETLSSTGMNYTRIFAGSYFEIGGESFGIQNNTLAPDADSVLTPWAVVSSSGKAMYDLSSWNEAYFRRLKDYLTQASARDIIVEVTLFSSVYTDRHWNICPQNPANNINLHRELNRLDVHTLNNDSLFMYQEKFVRKMVRELNSFDNFFFEIQNEPWADRTVPVYNIINKEQLAANDWTFKADFADSASMAWQAKVASIIADEEDQRSKHHLIAQNFTNFKAPIPAVNEHVSIINFHYAWPEAVEWNYHYNKVIGFDESGFAGPGNDVYRRQAWQFMLSGGGLFNSLDYSFFVGHEDGTGNNQAPGGGSDTLRRQLKTLHDFLHSFQLQKLFPDHSAVQHSPGLIPYVLADANNAYAIFLRAIGTTASSLKLKTGDGNYTIQTLNTITGDYTDPVTVSAANGIVAIPVDIPEGELALRIRKE